MKITLVVSPTSSPHQKFFEGVQRGLISQKIDYAVNYNSSSETHAVACWGWRCGERLRERGHNVLVFERGYIGDRFKWTSAGWNGLNRHADFCLPENITENRLAKHFPGAIKPWNPRGDKIVIMGQVRGDMSLRGANLTSFYEQHATQMKEKWKLPVFFRPHPAGVRRNLNFKPRIPIIYDDYADVIESAKFVFTYNSNSAVDSVLAGTPALSFDSGSMAWEVTGHKISDMLMPAREEWANKVAHCQYSPEEIESGIIWDRLKCKLGN